LNGGGVGSMDKINGTLLNDQDKCMVATETAVYLYNLDEDSGEAEDVPKIIAPDSELDSGGNKRWKLLGKITDSREGRQSLSSGQTSTNINFDFPFDDTGFQIVVTFLNTTDVSPSQYGYTITAKTVSGFTVEFSGAMDSDNYELHWLASRDLII
jgi:hypothetical protein